MVCSECKSKPSLRTYHSEDGFPNFPKTALPNYRMSKEELTSLIESLVNYKAKDRGYARDFDYRLWFENFFSGGERTTPIDLVTVKARDVPHEYSQYALLVRRIIEHGMVKMTGLSIPELMNLENNEFLLYYEQAAVLTRSLSEQFEI